MSDTPKTAAPPAGGTTASTASTPGSVAAGGPEIKKPKKKLNLDLKETELKLEKMVAAAAA